MANADLPERVRAAVTFNELDAATLFAGTHVGYTDYPKMGSTSATTTADLDVACV